MTKCKYTLEDQLQCQYFEDAEFYHGCVWFRPELDHCTHLIVQYQNETKWLEKVKNELV